MVIKKRVDSKKNQGYSSYTLDPTVPCIVRLCTTVVSPQGCWYIKKALGKQEEIYEKIRKHKELEGVSSAYHVLKTMIRG